MNPVSHGFLSRRAMQLFHARERVSRAEAVDNLRGATPWQIARAMVDAGFRECVQLDDFDRPIPGTEHWRRLGRKEHA